MRPNGLTAERLRDLLNYEPQTGVFRWKVTVGSRGVAGQACGTINSHGYSLIRVDKKLYRAHRLAWLHVTGKWPEGEIDHINGDRRDNCIANLRDVSFNVNQQNVRKSRKHNTSGYLGVTWDKEKQKWCAQLTVSGKHVHVGRFDDPAEAHAAYLTAKRSLHEGCTI